MKDKKSISFFQIISLLMIAAKLFNGYDVSWLICLLPTILAGVVTVGLDKLLEFMERKRDLEKGITQESDNG